MTASKIAFAKELQHLYTEKFGEKLEIDWPLMNGIREHIKERAFITSRKFDVEAATVELNSICKQYNTSIEAIRALRRINRSNIAERSVLTDYARWAVKSNLSLRRSAQLFNKEATLLYKYL